MRGGEERRDWKPQLQITKKLKKYILKLLECHFPTEANSAPQAPRRAGLHYILAGQKLPGQIRPRQGPGQGTLQFTLLGHTRLPGPGRRWQRGAGPQT